jgi:stage V sporulation protein D (sporulation-specific penicillin-binding protein)
MMPAYRQPNAASHPSPEVANQAPSKRRNRHAAQSQALRNRPFTILVGLGAVCAVLGGRLVYLQGMNGAYYHKRAMTMRAQPVTLKASRGSLLDRNGRPMAETANMSRLVCDPTQFKTRDPRATADALAPILGVSADELYSKLSGQETGGKRRHAILIDRLTSEQAVAIRDLGKQRQGVRLLDGIDVEEVPQRLYPFGAESAQLIGFLSPEVNEDKGNLGLEQSLNERLRGEPGKVVAEVDAHGRIIAETQVSRVDPHNGQNIRLSIDTTVQHIAASALQACAEKHSPAGATAIVMDPKTGDILAMVSIPTFDPLDRSGLKPPFEPLALRATRLYEPGSTFKVITIAAALQEGVIKPTDQFKCAGSMQLGNKRIKCVLHGESEKNGHGWQNAEGIIQHSCNVGAAQIAMKLGVDRFASYMQRFGLFEKTGIGVPVEGVGTLGFGQEAMNVSKAKAARMGFGQSLMVTPLALTSAFATLIRGGEPIKPRLILGECKPGATTFKEPQPETFASIINPQVAETVRRGLYAVVNGGNPHAAKVPGYSTSGKTGTAQTVIPGQHGYAKGLYVSSFIGVVPSNNPKAIIAVVVDRPNNGYYGAVVAAPVFREIAQQLMWYWKTPPDEPNTLTARVPTE